MGLSCFQPTYSFLVTGNSRCHDGEYIVETNDEDDIGIVI